MKKIAFALGIIAVVAAAILIWRPFRGRSATTADGFETAKVSKGTLLATVNASGGVMPEQSVSLIFPTGGVLAELSVTAGQLVPAGRPLARLDTRQLELSVDQAEANAKSNQARLTQVKNGPDAADIAAAEAAVASAEAAYDAAKSRLGLRDDQLTVAETALKKAELALRDAQAAYDLVSWRPEVGMLPQSLNLERATLDYQNALSNYKLQIAAIDDTALKSTASQLAQAKAQLDKLLNTPKPEDVTIAEAQVEQALASLEQARLRLADATLTAPFTGTVLSTNGQVGQLVSGSTAIVILGDLDSYHIDTTIDETDIGRVELGQEASIALDAYPDTRLIGKVSSIDLLGGSVQGVVSYDVEITIQPSDLAIRPGMTAIADIEVARKDGVLLVPNRALKRDSRGKHYVEMLTEGKVQQRFVTVGLSNETVTEIVEGLSEGEEIVVSAPRGNILQDFGESFSMPGTR